MKHELSSPERRILIGVATDLEAILAGGFPVGHGHATQKMTYDDASRGLVRPNAEKWLGDASSANRMQLSRLLNRLDRRGLLERVAAGSQRLTHIRLTAAGCELVDQLRREAVAT